jgi:hypothetical protein
MSDKQFEPCTLTEATHVEINKVVYQIVGNICTYNIGLRWLEEDVWIPIELFPILGIKPLKEIKPEPIEFEATFAHYDGKWHPLYSLDDGVSYQNCKKARFKCVEILEEKK